MLERMYFAFLVCSTLSACAISPDSLKTSLRQEKIVISERITVSEKRGLMNVPCEEGLLPGTYVAKFEDDQGTFFYGPERSIWMTNELIQKTPRLFVGGIYIPHKPSEAPQFFSVFEKDVHTAENIDALVQQRIATSSAGPGSGPIAANAAGNVLGGAIVAGLIELDVGKIFKYPPIKDDSLKRLIEKSRLPAP